MPIVGLRNLLKQVEQPIRIRDTLKRTSVIGLDAMKPLVDCVQVQEIFLELKSGRKEKAETYLSRFIRSIHQHGYMVVVVFPGRPLPSINFGENLKTQTGQGDKPFSFKTDIMQAFVTVMDAMGVPYMVSPYEQCAQLKYLSEIGLIDYVMTDNSDAIGYLCEKTLMDYDPQGEGGTAILYDSKTFLVLNEATAPAPLLKVLRKFGLKSLPLYCALQGCEYVQVKGFGPKKAIQMFIYFWHLEDMPDPNVLVKRMKVSRDTEKLVVAGYNIFTSQIIYDPILHTCRSLKSVVGNPRWYEPSKESETLPSYCGLHLDTKALQEYNHLQPKHFLVPPEEEEEVATQPNMGSTLTGKLQGPEKGRRADTTAYKYTAMTSTYYNRLNDMHTKASFFA